jgi:DNA mismatch repair protein MutS2
MNVGDDTALTLEYNKVIDSIAERAASRLGKEIVLALKPVDDADLVEARLRPILETMDLIAFDDPLSAFHIPDIRQSLQSISTPGTVLEIRELLDIGEVLVASERARAYVDKRKAKYPRLHHLTDQLSSHPELAKELERVLDLATESVRDNASAELRRLRRSIEQVRDTVREQAEAVLQRLPETVVQDRLLTIRDGRYVIPVRESQKGRVEGIVHDQSATGQTVFIEPMVSVHSSNRLRQLELAERQEILRILRKLVEAVADIRDEIAANLRILAQFDAIYAQAIYAREIDATEPLFNDVGTFRLNGARHPILYHRMRQTDQGSSVVPLDLLLGTEAYWTLILTGPNAGGKTVALKTVGLLALMAHAGLPVPAQPRSEIPRLSGVFADIGDAQSIENDLSTFSSHVANLGRICNEADGRSLVLLDEIGSSTDPDQGSALAVALLSELTDRGARTIATTHHGALKAFAHETDGIENGSMAFDAESLQPTFLLRLHVPGSSYAFEIARRFGLPDGIVDAAQKLAGEEVGKVETLIQKLDDTHRAYQVQLEAVEEERREIGEAKADYDQRLSQIQKRERDLRRTAQEEARQILNDANALIERTVQEIRKSEADTKVIRHARTAVGEARASLDRRIFQSEPHRVPVKASTGDVVFIPRLNQTGTVIAEGSRLMVEVGALKVEVSPREIEMRKETPKPKVDHPETVTTTRDREVALDVDLRGLTFDEASDVVDRYIDDLMLAGMERAAIIHGKGTGALRKKIGDYLRHDPRVKSQRLGDHNEGGSGVTVVELEVG